MRLVILAAAILFGFAQASYAQVSACKDALIQDVVVYKKTIAATLSFFRLIDKGNFEQNKTNLKSGASAVVELIPVEAWASYESFNEQRSRLFERFEFDSSIDSAESYFSQTVGDNAKAAYLACLQTVSTQNTGAHIYPTHYDDEVAIITLYWNPEASVTANSTPVSLIYAQGGELDDGTEFPDKVVPRQPTSVAFVRDPGSTLKLFIQAGQNPPFSFVVAGPPSLKTFCEDENPNDTLFLDTVTGQKIRACNACNDCRPGDVTTDAHVVEQRQYDAACVRNLVTSGRSDIRGFDCGWNAWGRQTFTMLYGDDGKTVEIEQNCDALREQAGVLGVKLGGACG